MNICLVSTGFAPEDGGGIGTYIFNLAQGLKARGHEVFVITPSRVASDDTEEIFEGLRVLRMRLRHVPKLESSIPGLAWSWAVSSKIRELDRRHGIDIVEFPNWEGVGYVYARLPGHKPVVTRVHTPYEETLMHDKRPGEITRGDRFVCWLERHACLLSDQIVSSTRHHRAYMSSLYGLTEDGIRIVPLGIDIRSSDDVVEQRWQRPEPKVMKVLYVSRLESRKGTLTFLQAIPRIIDAHPDIEFNLIGRDRNHAPGNLTFQQYFKSAYGDYADKVHFLGFTPDEQVEEHYNNSDVFIVPSLYESFGLIFVEAMAHGLPLIGGRAGGIPEVVEEDVTGYLISENDVEDLARKALELINSRALRHSMGRLGVERYRQQFSRHAMAANTESIYQEVLVRRKS